MAATHAWPDAVKDAKRDLLLAAAREEFADKGLDGATMRGIALRAGCTTGAIYPLFDSKEAIYAALLADSLARLGRAVDGAIDAAADSAIEARIEATIEVSPDARARAQVQAGCRAFIDHYRQHPFEVNLGLYAFRGVRRQGVGRHPDQALNQALEQVLNRLATALAAARGETTATVRPLVMVLFTQMIGALVLEMTGRLDALHADGDQLHALMLTAVLTAVPTAALTAVPAPATARSESPGSRPTPPTRPPRRPRRS